MVRKKKKEKKLNLDLDLDLDNTKTNFLRVKKQDQQQPAQPSRATLAKREQMAAAAEARLKAASARQQLW